MTFENRTIALAGAIAELYHSVETLDSKLRSRDSYIKELRGYIGDLDSLRRMVTRSNIDLPDEAIDSGALIKKLDELMNNQPYEPHWIKNI